MFVILRIGQVLQIAAPFLTQQVRLRVEHLDLETLLSHLGVVSTLSLVRKLTAADFDVHILEVVIIKTALHRHFLNSDWAQVVLPRLHQPLKFEMLIV